MEGSSAIRAGDEDASQLILGPDFQDKECLLISEVAVLLERKHSLAAEDGEKEQTPVFMKTLAYVQRFNRYKTKASAEAVRQLLQQKGAGLSEYELAALSNLGPETADEAKSLIPTLSKHFDDVELQSILDDLATFRRMDALG